MFQKSLSRSLSLRRSPSGFGLAIVAAALTAGASFLHAQDSGALVDKLVQKGILSSQEATEVKADMAKDAASAVTRRSSEASPYEKTEAPIA